jgi:UMF1 family MFS transporter
LRSPKEREMAFSDDGEDYDAEMTGKSYEGEDTSPTTERELKGWYAYPIAAEVFAVVAVGM